MEPKLISVKEGAKYLGISEWTLYHWIGRKMIPHVKLGTRTMLRLADLDRIIESHTQPASTPLPTGQTKGLSYSSDNGAECQKGEGDDAVHGIM